MILEAVCTDYGIVPIIKTIKTLFIMIQIIAPILAIVALTKICFDAIKGDEDTFKLVKKKIINTITALVIVFFLPFFVNLIMSITFMQDTFDVAACWNAAEKVNLNGSGKYIDKSTNKNKFYIVQPKDYDKGGSGFANQNKNNSSKNDDNSTGSNDKAGKAGTSNSGKVTYLTKNGKNWNLNSKIGYSLNQSACSDGTYLYVTFKSDDSHARIGKFDMASRKLVKKSKVMNLGHANDMTYDPSRNKIFVTRRENNDLNISMIDPETFNHSVVAIKIPGSISGIHAFNGIAYDKNRGQLLIRARYGRSQLVWVNDNFKAVKVLHISKWLDIPTQGMEIVDNKVVYSQSIGQYRSSVASYNINSGKKVKSTNLGVHGELEGVFYHNGDLYGITYDKRGNNKSLVYMIGSEYY